MTIMKNILLFNIMKQVWKHVMILNDYLPLKHNVSCKLYL